MNILLMTIPVSMTLGLLFVLFFLSAVKDDQFDDLDTPGHLPLTDGNDDENFMENHNLKNNIKKNDEERVSGQH
jgi:cbb3-type cytochrome oxidase maturation protein